MLMVSEHNIEATIERLEKHRYPVAPLGSESGPDWLPSDTDRYWRAREDADALIEAMFPTLDRRLPGFAEIPAVVWLRIALLECGT